MSHGYFADAPDEEIGAKILSKLDAYADNETVGQIASRLHDAWLYYYGYDPSGFHATSAISRGGDQGELAEIRVNHARSLVNTLLNLITAQKLSWQPKATNLDYASVAETELASSILEYYWADKSVSQYAARAVEEAIAFTEGFVFVEWDGEAGDDFSAHPDDPQRILKSGDLRFTNVSSWHVTRDPKKRSWRELDWVIVDVPRNKYDLAARYPEQAEDILSAGLDDRSRGGAATTDSADSDDVLCHFFFHKPCPVLPLGKELLVLSNGVVLYVRPMRDEEFPLFRCSPSELIGTPYGYSPFLEILGIQELMDSLHSSAATNLSTFGTQNIAVPQGSEIPIDQLAGGMRVIYYPQGTDKPSGLQLTATPAELYSHLESLKKDQEMLFGLNAVVRGEAQSDKLSGAALALLQSTALQQSAGLQTNYLAMVQAIGNCVIRFIQKYASIPRKISLVGKQNSYLVQEQEYTGEGLGQIKRVTCEIGNPMAQTAAGRAEMAKEMMQMGLVKTPEQYQQVLSTGRFDPLVHGTKTELINILSENEDISRGATPAAMLHDNHLMHGREHTVPVGNPAARKNPDVLRAFTEHMHQHYSLYFGVPIQVLNPPAPVDPMTGQPVLDPMGQPLPPPGPQDPLYRERMLMLMGMQPPPPMMPPGGLPPGGMPPGPGGPPPGPSSGGGPPPAPPGSEPSSAQPAMPSMPTNPATGQEWNPVDGGGAVPS